MKQNIIRELVKVTDTKDRSPLKKAKTDKNNIMQMKMANYAIDFLQNFEPNLTLLNEIIYTTTR